MDSMLLPNELLAQVVDYLDGDGRSMINLMLSCKQYFDWMVGNKLFDNFWKIVARNIRRQLSRDFSDFDDTSASAALSGSWYREVMDLGVIKRNWRSGVCRSRAVDMHNYGCLKFCKYDNKHLLVGSGNGKLLVMNIVEQGAKGFDGDNKDTNDAGVTDDNEPCTTPNRANSSRVTLRKKHHSNTLALKTVRTMKCNTEAVSCCQPFLRSNKFVTGGWDCKVKIWDFEKLKPTRINEHFGSVEALEIYDDRQLIVGTSTENSVQIYDIARAAIVAIPGEDAPAVWQVELNQTNDVLVFGCVDGGITLYDVRKLQKMHTIKCYSKAVRSLKWQSRSEHQFFVSTEGSVFHQWDARKLDEPLRKINVPTNRSEGVFLRLHQNDQVVAAVGSNGMLYMYDAKSFALLYMIPASHQAANSIVMDEFNLYIGFANGSLRTFDFDVLPENVNVNPKTKITPKSMQKLIGLHGYEYNAHVY